MTTASIADPSALACGLVASPLYQGDVTTKVKTKKYAKRVRRCRRSGLGTGLELSPIFFAYVISRRRRRMP